MPTALITGVTGQDGSYLADLLVGKGYRVVGTSRRADAASHERIQHLAGRLEIATVDLLAGEAIASLLRRVAPDEIYNLAAPSSVAASWAHPVAAGEGAGLAVTILLEAIRRELPHARVFQASSSEIFGRPTESPQHEATPIAPTSPYGAAKAFAHFMVRSYREAHGLYAVCGILFNHESPRRGVDFVSRKVSDAAARIHLQRMSELRLGSLDVRRDWGYAGDAVDAMWRMLQKETPDDYVVGTGETHSVRELVDTAFRVVGLDYHEYVVQETRLMRPSDPSIMVADATKARAALGWAPTVSFDQLVRLMVEHDVDRYRE